MSLIILDMSGNTIKNNLNIGRWMIDEVAKRDTKKHEIIFKAQLFEKEGNNVPLNKVIFANIYQHAKEKGYQMTASVFDIPSLEFLLMFDVPFIKIACRPDLYWLIGEIPRKIPVYVSVELRIAKYPNNTPKYENGILLGCVREYPGKLEDYLPNGGGHLIAISDHTVGLELFRASAPTVWEKHLKLRDSTGPDAGPFAILPSELDGII